MTTLASSLQRLAQALSSPPDRDPVEGLLDVAKSFVAKRKTPDTVPVRVDELQVDPDYQRPPDRDKITTFVAHRRAGHQLPPIECNVRPDGSKWITDGQHRAAAAAIVGDDRIDAILTAVPQQEEPQLTNIMTKVTADRDQEMIRMLVGYGAKFVGKQLLLGLGKAGEITYLPHAVEWVGKTERGRLIVTGEDPREIVARLGLGAVAPSGSPTSGPRAAA